MFKISFSGGVHPPDLKYLTRNTPVRKSALPKEAIIPLSQHAGAQCLALVKPGDEVRAGSLIAKSEKLISSHVHASISGKVKAIRKSFHPVIGKCEAIVIESDGKDEKEVLANVASKNPEDFTAQEIIEAVREAGIAGLGGAAFPTHVKLMPPKDKKVDTFILNAAECEPYLTCDERVVIENAEKVLKGTLLMMKALGVDKGIIVIEDNKPEALISLQKATCQLSTLSPKLSTIVLKTKYPQGGEKQIIKAILKKEVPANKLPFDVGCVVDNVQTALAVYEAVYEKKALYERVVTVSGDCVKSPANILARIGTPISHLIEECGGMKEGLFKLIIGGPMMGVTQYSTDVPVIKGTSGVLLLGKKACGFRPPLHCVKCGKCIEVCPVNLIPTDIAKAAEYGRFDIAKELNACDCIECGCCSYACATNIQLVHLIRYAKRRILCET